MFQVIFSDLYHVPKLPFDDYVTTVFEKYIHSLIEIEPLVRFLLLLPILFELLPIRPTFSSRTGWFSLHCWC